jgi:hypothetical protein
VLEPFENYVDGISVDNKKRLYMDSKVFLTRVESKEESRALPRFLTL